MSSAIPGRSKLSIEELGFNDSDCDDDDDDDDEMELSTSSSCSSGSDDDDDDEEDDRSKIAGAVVTAIEDCIECSSL